MNEINIPATGQPQGPQGKNRVAVSKFNDLVVIHVETPQEYMPFNAVGAVDIATRMMAFAVEADKQVAQLVINAAMLLIDHAYEVRGDLKPAGSAVKHELIERHRKVLTNRVGLMLNTLREDRTKSNGHVAKAVVEACLKEVF